ncbi:MAG TPA: hypothetical protein VEG65_00315 [Candidatus Bathyarchaeia archaeon]|nr:hypothetical protein [Candidatus Bathyarchaeia archaeon]
MQVEEKMEKPLKWFVLPNESYKWDFVLEKFVVENTHQEAALESERLELSDDGFDKDYIVTHKKRKQRDRYYY